MERCQSVLPATQALDLDGMMQAGAKRDRNLRKGDRGTVGRDQSRRNRRPRALSKAQGDNKIRPEAKSRLARATLRTAAEAMRREEEERRERYVAGQTLLYKRERDIALASYDGEPRPGRSSLWARPLTGRARPRWRRSCIRKPTCSTNMGEIAAATCISSLRSHCGEDFSALASTEDERGAAGTNLGNALATFGEREGGTARLEAAVAAYHAALEELTRERVPLLWARAQSNLGNALSTFGERESGTARLEAAVAYRATLEESTRERVPLMGDDAEQPRPSSHEARGAGERDGAARGGGQGLTRGAGGEDARTSSVPMSDDTDEFGVAL